MILNPTHKDILTQYDTCFIFCGTAVGTRYPPVQLLKKHRDIVKLLKNGHSVRHTTKITEKGFSTVQRVKAVWLKNLDPSPIAA